MITLCPTCGQQWPIGNRHDCPTHINPVAANPVPVIFMNPTAACAPQGLFTWQYMNIP